jgi:hypothetical protein
MINNTKLLTLLLTVATVAISNSASISAQANWKTSLVSHLGINQTTLSNWSAGGDNIFSWRLDVDGNFDLIEDGFSWENALKIAYGSSRTGSDNDVKSADEIKFDSVYTWQLGGKFNPFVSFSLLTQLTESYDYSTSPATPISNFFDPGYLTQSVGIGYAISPGWTVRLGGSVKETITNVHTNFGDGHKFFVEPGVEVVSDYKRTFEERFKFTSKLEIFSNLKGYNEIDYAWDNQLSVEVVEYISLLTGIKAVYDKDASDTQQLKSFYSFGLRYSIL